MNSVAALILTFVQLVMVLSAVSYNNLSLLGTTVIYGSPLYLVTHVPEANPFMYGKEFANFMVLSFHTFKYFFLIRAYSIETGSTIRLSALLLEFAYLGICLYYANLL